jgi:hypothetical protein
VQTCTAQLALHHPRLCHLRFTRWALRRPPVKFRSPVNRVTSVIQAFASLVLLVRLTERPCVNNACLVDAVLEVDCDAPVLMWLLPRYLLRRNAGCVRQLSGRLLRHRHIAQLNLQWTVQCRILVRLQTCFCYLYCGLEDANKRWCHAIVFVCWSSYRCSAGSSTPVQFECGGANVYCPIGSPTPKSVDTAYFSIGGGGPNTRANQTICEPGNYWYCPLTCYFSFLCCPFLAFMSCP